MNKRIRELAEQAGITTNLDTDYFEKDINKWVDYYSEKFAMLIVQECMRMCEVAEIGLLTHGLREQSYGASNAKQYISDWFEVEE